MFKGKYLRFNIRDNIVKDLIGLLHQTLYDYGARKFVLIGVGQIGCSPNALAQNSPDGRTCAENINNANKLFNNRLKGIVDEFNGNTPDAKFIYINAYDIFQDLIDNPSAFGKYFFLTRVFFFFNKQT